MPVMTTAATAIVVEVSSGNAPIRTAVIAETKIANRCQAGAVSPAGTGEKAIPNARTKGKTRLASNRRLTVNTGCRDCALEVADLLLTVAGLVMTAGLLVRLWPVPNLRGHAP